jgi:spore maturation protein CgeB
MKIMVFGRQLPDSFAKNISVTLQQMGHEVRAMDDQFGLLNPRLHQAAALLLQVVTSLNDRHQLRFVTAAVAWQPDLIINAYANLPPKIVEKIKRETDAVVVSWFPDAQSNLGRQYLLKAPYDALFFKDPYIVNFCKKLEKPAFYLPECCNPLWHKPVTLTTKERDYYACDLTTAGNMYYYRALMLEQFQDYSFKIWGLNYPRWLESPLAKVYQYVYVTELEKAKAFNAAKIVLNTVHFAEILSVNCRTFEIAGCGGFQITENRPQLKEFYEPDKEIVVFETKKELKEKVDYYLNRPHERQEIAHRGHLRAHKEHTYGIRLKTMLNIIEGLK